MLSLGRPGSDWAADLAMAVLQHSTSLHSPTGLVSVSTLIVIISPSTLNTDPDIGFIAEQMVNLAVIIELN